jgi:DNA-binding Lrp family transcriptional regulator
MARPRGESDILKHPLDEVLGTRAMVRLVRLMAHEVDAPLTAPDAADRVGLTPAAARASLERLARTGFVGRVGAGKTVQYQLKESEPLVEALRAVFRAEQDRYDTFLKQLRALLEGTPEVLSAWIERPPSAPGSPLEIVVVAKTDAIPWIGRELRLALTSIESRSDQVIEMALFSRADAPTPVLESVIPLSGSLSIQWPPPPGRDSASHAATEDRSLRMSVGIARLLRDDPSMATRALRHLERLLREDQGLAGADLMEWKQLLEAYSPERLGSFLASTSSRAARLRQSSPFFAILSPDERDRLVDLLGETR